MQTNIDRHLSKREKKQAPTEKHNNTRRCLKLRLAWCKKRLAELGKKSELRVELNDYHSALCKALS